MARQVMLAQGFEPDFPPATRQQLADISAHPSQLAASDKVRDLRGLLWSSIDNDTSKDLDQIEVAERLPNGDVKVMVGIADVDAFVAKGTPIDQHAAKEATTVYTGICNFAMLPEELSTGASSLLENVDRPSVVIEFVVNAGGSISASDVYRAIVRNKAQLTYGAVGAWLEGTAAAPPKVAALSELQAQLKRQDEVAQALKKLRYEHGALNIDTSEVHPVVLNQQVVDVVKQEKNRATELIEDFMITANGVVARLLEEVSSLRRIVKTPEHWDGIVRLAAAQGEKLPAQADSKALNDFLLKRKAADPDHFADLSLAVIKLIGPGEICSGASGRYRAGTLRTCRAGLHALDRAQPALCGHRHATADQEFARRKTRALFRRRTRWHRHELHTERRCSAKSGARNVEAVGRRGDEPSGGSNLRRHGHRSHSEGNVCSRSSAAHRRIAGTGSAGVARGRQAARKAYTD